jgi:cytochrome c-type biogenesis protein CcmH/NrfG
MRSIKTKKIDFGKNIFILATLVSTALLTSPVIAESINKVTDADQQTFAKSFHYENIGDLKNAIAVIPSESKNDAANYSRQVRLGYLYLTLGQFSNAESHYLNALKTSPNALAPTLGLMRIYNTQLQFDKTEQLAYRATKEDSKNYYANMYLTYALRMQKKMAAAEQVNKIMLTLYPDDITFLSELALIRFAEKSFVETAALISRIRLLEPENAVAKDLHYQILQNK